MDIDIDILYADLFTQRLYYQDLYNNEIDIIKKLKLYLYSKNINITDINNILFAFYQYYNINNITLDFIQNATVHVLPYFNIPNNNNINNYINIINRLIRHRYNNENNNEYNNENEYNNNENENENENDNNENDNNENENDNNENDNNENDNNENIIVVLNRLNNINNYMNIMDVYLNINNQLEQHLEDVIVTVNDDDLDKMTKIIVSQDTDIECSICLNNIIKDDEIIKLSCTHSYHYNCIMVYLKQYNHKCPICRCEIGTAKYNITN